MSRSQILIVEDEVIVAMDLERQLAALGYEPVGIAVDAVEAIRLATERRPQLVLMDIHLAGDTDGIEAAIAIRSKLGIPCIFITAYATDDVIERAKQAEPLGYINKPFDRLTLRSTVEIALHHSRSDARLRQSEARYRAIIESASDAVVTATVDGIVVGWSPAAVTMFGYTELEAIGQPISILTTASLVRDQVAVVADWKAAPVVGAYVKAREVIGRRKNGTEFPIELSLAAWQSADGWFMTAFIRDISERRQADAALRMARAVGAKSPAVLFRGSVAPGWPVEFVSENIKGQFGYAPEDFTSGRVSFESAVHPEDRAAMLENTARYLASGADHYSMEFRVMTKDRVVRWAEFSNTVERDREGQPIFVEGILLDVTERRQAEAAQRLQSAALNAAANAIVITDADGAIEWANPAFTALTGYGLAEAIGRNPRDLVKSGAHDTAFYRHMWETITSGHVWEGELTNRRKDGTHYIEQQTITPVRDAKGRITHFVGIKRDLTAEKQLQEQFLQAQKMEVVGRLAGGIAHDFNNLLTIINGESELALAELPPGDASRAAFEYIRDAGQRATRLTRQLLTFSRKQVAAPSVFSVAAYVASLAPMIRRLLGEDVTLALAIPEVHTPDHVRIDTGQLEQVLLNLAVNARDAMPNGGTLTIGVSPIELDDTTAAAHANLPAGRYVRLAVSDTGTGIPADVRSRIFEPFFTTKPQGKGTGLGLAMVYGLVTQSGGCIEVDSEPGHGATFRMFFPAAAVDADRTPAVSATPPRGNETIMLVEDEQEVRELTARMLRAAGYVVIPMPSSADALSWFSTNRTGVDLLLTDVVMPGMTGPELVAALDRTHPRLRVLFASGHADDRLSSDVIADPLRFLAKPFTTAALLGQVRAVLDTPVPA